MTLQLQGEWSRIVCGLAGFASMVIEDLFEGGYRFMPSFRVTGCLAKRIERTEVETD